MAIQGNMDETSVVNPKIRRMGRRGLYRIAGAAGMITASFLLTALICLIVSVCRPAASENFISFFQNIWLSIIFKLHAGFDQVQIELLHQFNLLDLVLLAIVGVMFLGLHSVLQRTSKVWSIIAAIQPLLGIAIFLSTKSAGRSAVMGSALVISMVMLRSQLFSKGTAYLGILASVLLLVGDFSAGVIPASAAIASLVGIGYVSLMIWYFLVARTLFHLAVADRGENG